MSKKNTFRTIKELSRPRRASPPGVGRGSFDPRRRRNLEAVLPPAVVRRSLRGAGGSQ